MGGARINAGRKLNPRPVVRILIGIECERQFAKFTQLAADAAHEDWENRKSKTLIPVHQKNTRRKRDKAVTDALMNISALKLERMLREGWHTKDGQQVIASDHLRFLIRNILDGRELYSEIDDMHHAELRARLNLLLRPLKKNGVKKMTPEEALEQILGEEMRKLKRSLPKATRRGQGTFKMAVSIPINRPKGWRGYSLRDKILEDVAGRYSVTKQVADKCWNEWRRYLQGKPTPWWTAKDAAQARAWDAGDKAEAVSRRIASQSPL